jgi:molecular chaperone GrpE
VDDDQVNNDTSRAPEPDNLTGAQAEVDPEPGATKTDTAERPEAGGQTGANPPASHKGGQAAGAKAGDRGATGGDKDAGESAGSRTSTAEAGSSPGTGRPGGAAGERGAGAGQAATATSPAGDRAAAGDAADGEEDGGEPAAQRAGEAGEPDAATGADHPQAGRADAESDSPEAAEADQGSQPVAAAEAAEADEPPTAVEEESSEAALAELVSARAEAEGYLDDLRRLQAEFDNYRKRIMREQSARIASASQSLVSRLLPVLDNFELAVSHAEQSRDFDRMLKGVEMVFGELNDLLASEGLVPIEASGKPFDPERHEAVVAVEEDGVEPGTVVDVIRKGYEFNGRVLRPAMVKVAR